MGGVKSGISRDLRQAGSLLRTPDSATEIDGLLFWKLFAKKPYDISEARLLFGFTFAPSP